MCTQGRELALGQAQPTQHAGVFLSPNPSLPWLPNLQGQGLVLHCWPSWGYSEKVPGIPAGLGND